MPHGVGHKTAAVADPQQTQRATIQVRHAAMAERGDQFYK
jgi:hypothetical protein